MSPLSGNARARARSLANLQRGGGVRPAADGHRPNLRHGAYAVIAADRLDAKAREVFAALAADAPLRAAGELPAADGAAVRLAADALCRLDGLHDYLARRGIEDAKGALRVVELDLERRLRAEAADHLDSLGMTPRARARLGLDVARAAGFDLAAQWAEDWAEDDDAIEGTVADA